MKFVTARTFADPDAAARKLVEIANAVEAVQDGRIAVELINAPFLEAGGTPAEYRAGIEWAISEGWLWQHASGGYVKFTQPELSCSHEKRVFSRDLRQPIIDADVAIACNIRTLSTR